MHAKNLSVCVLFVFLVALPQHSVGGEPADSHALYQKDRISLQVVTGPMFASSVVGPDIPDFNYWLTNVRLGWMFTSPEQDGGFWNGNWEALLELSNSIIYDGFGDYVFGLSGLIRYNFADRESRFIPYLQAGFGLVYSDAYEDLSQGAIGQAVNFMPQAGVGFRYLVGKSWSLDAEALFQHISNAGMDERNDGVNAFGACIGISYFWDGLWR